MKKTKLKKIFGKINTFEDDTRDTFLSFDKEVANFSVALKEAVSVKTLDQASRSFRELQTRFKNLDGAIENLKASLTEREEKMSTYLEERVGEIINLLSSSKHSVDEKLTMFASELSVIQLELETLNNFRSVEPVLRQEIKDTGDKLEEKLRDFIAKIKSEVDKVEKVDLTEIKDELKKVATLEKDLEKLRTDLISRMGQGGNANRQIKVGGTDVLTRYTDINLVAGTNVTLTAATDDTNKRTNITIASSGGGAFTEIAISGTINDSNTAFTAASEPTYLVINGVWYKGTGGAITWTYVAGDITLSTPVGTGGQIFGIS